MPKCICFLILFFCLANHSNGEAAGVRVNLDSLATVLKIKDRNAQEKNIFTYIVFYFQNNPARQLDTVKTAINAFLAKNNIENKEAFKYFMESLYQRRMLQPEKAENALIRGIDIAGKADDHYLLYRFLSHLAILQTDMGNIIGAISSYRMSKKEAVKLNDPFLQVLVDINISDAYYRYNFYKLSLYYLDQANDIYTASHLNAPRLITVINYNKSENFFRMNNIDSLKVYNQKLKTSTGDLRRVYTYQKRTDYYLNLLKREYKVAIAAIKMLQKDTTYKFSSTDAQNLAQAYYNSGGLDSAKQIIIALVNDPEQNNHPEIKFQLYKTLGEIAEKQNDQLQAAYNFKMALLQSQENSTRLTQVGNISLLMKIDEIESSYIQKDAIYERERMWLVFVIIVASLTIAIIAMFYRSVKQKRHYEKLLFTAKKEELAFINSHDVRKHLTNILGIIDVIRHSDDKGKEYIQAEDHLFYSSEQLDKAIKNISEKLDG
ncbi:hypothetical protein BH09BAC6_BH09BAC6_09440 [soil metagenome]